MTLSLGSLWSGRCRSAPGVVTTGGSIRLVVYRARSKIVHSVGCGVLACDDDKLGGGKDRIAAAVWLEWKVRAFDMCLASSLLSRLLNAGWLGLADATFTHGKP